MRANSPPIEAFGGNEQDKVENKSTVNDPFVGNHLVGVVVVKAEQDNANRHQERTGGCHVGESIGVVLDDALDGTKGIQIGTVLLGIRHGDESDEGDVLDHEDGGGDHHDCGKLEVVDFPESVIR